MTKVACHKYFGRVVGDEDRNWTAHICCQTCAANLSNWLNGKRSSMPFPIIWRESTNHFIDCYFCMIKVPGFSRRSKHNIEYPDIPSAIRPVLHGKGLPVPVSTANWDEDLEVYGDKAEAKNVLGKDGSYFPESEEKAPHLIEEAELKFGTFPCQKSMLNY